MAEYVTHFEAAEGVSRANFNRRIDEMNMGLAAAAGTRAENIVIASSYFAAFEPEAGSEEEKLHNLGYQYRAEVAVEGATTDMIPYVTLSLADVEAAGVGIANQFCCCDGGVYVYADGSPASDITALTIELRKAVG